MAGFCPDCGTARDDGAQTCGNCNHQFASSSAAPDENPEPSRSKRLTPKWIGIGVGAITLAIVGVWVANSDVNLPGLAGNSNSVVDVSLLPVAFGGKCGYVDASGKMVINPQFDDASSFNSELGVAQVLVDKKWGLIDREGKYIVNPQFDELNIDSGSNVIRIVMSGKAGTINPDGSFAINPQFDELSGFDSRSQSIARVGQKYGVVDSSGKYIISPEFDNVIADWFAAQDKPDTFNLTGGPLLVVQQGKFGFVDGAGKVTIQPQFSAAGPFDSSGYAPVAIQEADTDTFNRIRDENASAVETVIQARLSHLILGNARRDGLKIHFDLTDYNAGDAVRNWLNQNISTGQWSVTSNINRDPQGFATAASITLEQILEAPKRDKYGYVDSNGKFAIAPQFAEAGNFSAAGLAPVRVGTVYGYVDTKGKVKINPQWSYADAFRQVDGAWLAIVGIPQESSGEHESNNARYGLIDANGAYKINPQFDGLASFNKDGFAIAQSGDLVGAVNSSGRYVLQPVYKTLIPIAGTSKFVFVKQIAGIEEMQEIGVVDSEGKVITTVRGGVCNGIYSFGRA